MTAKCVVRRFGEDMTIAGKAAKGFIFPVHHKNGEIHREPLRCGVKNGESYLLITDTEVREGDELLCAGERFEVMRRTEVRFMGNKSHTEAVLRSLGGIDDV